jgi:lipopolysaccharide/colanic/teichoic acid biosynthesis glycosyltransferase
MSTVHDAVRFNRSQLSAKTGNFQDAAQSMFQGKLGTEANREANVSVEVAPYFVFKPVVDRVITAGLMVFALPLMAVVGLTVLALDGRPVFYRQTRVGKNGRHFRIWKFRTMRPDAEKNTGAVWSSAGDPRITTLGRWLRSSHLDELPQFINVLAGEMNLIGPRPERPEFVNELARELPTYMERIRVAPGITGLAQIRNGYDQCFADVRRKVAVDLEYIRTASLAQDLTLLAETSVYIWRHLWEARIRANSNGSPGLLEQYVHEHRAGGELVGPHILTGVATAGQAMMEIMRSHPQQVPWGEYPHNSQEVAAEVPLLGTPVA